MDSVVAFLGGFALYVAIFLAQAFALMLVLGGLHFILPVIPALGYWGAALLLMASNILFKSVRTSKAD